MAKSESYKDKVYHYLKEQIENNTLLPDTHLKEVEIANKLGVSRTPVRKAIERLAKEGYVTIVPYKGAVVAKSSLNTKAIIERLQFIELLTTNLFQQMQSKAIKVNVDELDDIEASMKKCLDKNDLKGYYKQEYRFFEFLASYHSNNYFRQVAMNTISTLHELYFKEAEDQYDPLSRESKEAQKILPDLFQALRDADYPTAIKQVRLWVNQLILERINL